MTVSLSAYAEFDKFQGDGYFWYKDPSAMDEVEEKNSPPVPAPPKPLKPEEVPLSTAWISANIEKLRERAIDDPTKENVANYMYAQRIMIDKAQNFATMTNQVVTSDPFLDEENRVPSSSYANILFSRKSRSDKSEAIQFLSSKGGIWLFTDTPDKCSACATYRENVIRSLVNTYKFNFTEINVSTEQGLNVARNLKLKVTPATIYVKPRDPNLPMSEQNKDETFILSEGLLSLSQIEDRIIIAANMGNLLPKDLSAKANPYQKGVLSKDDFVGLKMDDPSAVMKAFREKIKGEGK
jgi:conjugal transfer pilus assembly protein TraF